MGVERVKAGRTARSEPQVAAARTSWIELLPLGGVLLFVFLLGCHQMRDSDLWWHLRTGQLIFARGVVPATDWYTYGSPDARWIDLNWLWQLAAAGVWSLTGTAGIVIATSLIGTATFALLFLRGHRARVSPAVAAMLAVAPVMLFAYRYPARPESCAFLFLSSMLVICHLAAERPRLLWLLPLIQVLWTNTHGSFVLGLVVVACFAAEAAALAMWNRGRAGGRQPTCTRWMLVALACLAACLVNPYGSDALRFVFLLNTRLGSGDTAQFYKQLAEELCGLGEAVQQDGLAALHTGAAALIIAATALAAGGFALLLWKRRETHISRWLLSLCFTYLGWQAYKNVPFFALVALAVALWNLDDYLAGEKPQGRRAGSRLPVLSGLLVFLLALSVPTNAYFEIVQKDPRPRYQTRFGFTDLSEWSPHAEAKYLGGPNMPSRVFAICHPMASAYIFHNGPERKVFVDGRLEVSKRETYQRMFDIMDLLLAHDPRAEAMLLADVPADATGPREMPALLLCMSDFLGKIENLLHHPRWRPVFVGDTAIVFLYEPDAQRRGIPAVDPDAVQRAFYSRALEVKPDSARNHFYLGKALYRSDRAAAAEHFRRACALEPDFSAAHCNYAACIAASDPALAEQHCRMAISCDPQNAGAFCNYGNLLLQEGRYAEAVARYRRALQLDPQLELARRNLASAEKQATLQH